MFFYPYIYFHKICIPHRTNVIFIKASYISNKKNFSPLKKKIFYHPNKNHFFTPTKRFFTPLIFLQTFIPYLANVTFKKSELLSIPKLHHLLAFWSCLSVCCEVKSTLRLTFEALGCFFVESFAHNQFWCHLSLHEMYSWLHWQLECIQSFLRFRPNAQIVIV